MVVNELLMMMIGMMSMTRTIIRRLIQANHTTRISVSTLLPLLLVYSNTIRINSQVDFIRFTSSCSPHYDVTVLRGVQAPRPRYLGNEVILSAFS